MTRPPMDCCDATCYDGVFDEALARDELEAYRRDGPEPTTRRLIEALVGGRAIEGLTVLDIGAGVGAVHHELLSRGAAFATDVDASGPYLDAAQEEAGRVGHLERTRYVKGDFATLTESPEPADIVALDRVVCCYDDAAAMLGRAAALTRWRLGLVYPRDLWPYRVYGAVSRRWSRLRGKPNLFNIHRDRLVEQALVDGGLQLVHRQRGWFWQVAVFERPAD